MNIAGIICEYNPLHNGHVRHFDLTREALGEDIAIVCVMSGNFVQRGDAAVFSKHARAEAAVLAGADLVIELPLPYALSSAERFARAGIALIDSLGICTHVSFGSEIGALEPLYAAMAALEDPESSAIVKEELAKGISYPMAMQRAAERGIGDGAAVLRFPNNLLGVEYLRAIESTGSKLIPLTILRKGAGHNSNSGESSSALRKKLKRGDREFSDVPAEAARVFKQEIDKERGPVFLSDLEIPMISRLRMLPADIFNALPDATEGLASRLGKFCRTEPTVKEIIHGAKTKRYTLARVRRMVMCACLGVTASDADLPPPYIRVLATGERGKTLLKMTKPGARLPVVIKPASVLRLGGRAAEMMGKEAAATDFYALAYKNAEDRAGGAEWRTGPRIV